MSDLNFENTDQLRDAVTDWALAQRRPAPQEALAPNVPADAPQEVKDAAAKAYADAILAKPTGTWTKEERAFMAKATAVTLRSLGY